MDASGAAGDRAETGADLPADGSGAGDPDAGGPASQPAFLDPAAPEPAPPGSAEPPDDEPGAALLAAGAAQGRRDRAARRRGAWRIVGVGLGGALVGAIAAGITVPTLRAGAQGLPSIQTVAQPVQAAAGAPAISVYKALGPAVVLVSNQQASGSGFFGSSGGATDWGSGLIVASDGYIVTNDHVIQNSAQISVTLADGASYPAKMVGSDPSTDLAVIKISPTQPLQPATFANSNDVVPGQVAIAIGNPLGPQDPQSVDQGIVSAIRPTLYGLDASQERVTTMIQTDAAINPGNSGGPLANAQGQVIGIVSMKTVSTGERGVQAVGLGFAIPSNLVRRVANELIQYGYFKWAWLGITFPPNVANALPGQSVKLTVATVAPGTPAAGVLQVGDAITSWNGQPVRNYYDLVADITAAQPGQTVALGIVRKGRAETVHITLGTEPEAEALGQTSGSGGTGGSGAGSGSGTGPGGVIVVPGFPGYGSNG